MDARLPLAPVEQETDEELMEAAKRGDRAAFAAFYARWHAGIQAFFRARLWRAAWEDADDLAAEVWVRAWGKRAQYRALPGSRPKDWLYRIARNLWMDWCRRPSNRQPADPLEYGERGQSAALIVAAPDATAALAAEAVRAAVADLIPSQREVVALHWFEGRSNAAAAARLGTTEEGAKQRQIRAYRHLRTALAAYAPGAA